MTQVLFLASLSNGETVYEGKGNWQREAGAPSPWERLRAYCLDNDLTITSLALYNTKDHRRWHIPAGGSNPRFHAFATAPKPIDLNFFRKLGTDIKAKTQEVESQETYAVLEALYGGARLQVWVNEQTMNCYTLLVNDQ